MADSWTCPPLTSWGDDSGSGEHAAADDESGHSSGTDLQAAPRKRPGEELDAQPGCSRLRKSGESHEEFAPFQQLSVVQRSIISKIVGMLDTEQDSVVISNPLQPHSPIVYVTNAWQDMCGYNMGQAIGKNPRVTQGEGSDPKTIEGMGRALSNQQACRVRLINYRGGINHEPFWNCLSVQPIFYKKQLVLFAARLQDYSYRMTRLVSLQPQQFCKSGSCFQYRVRLSDLRGARSLSQARCVDVTAQDLGEKGALEQDDDATSDDAGDDAVRPGASASSTSAPQQLPARHVKRLGFGGLLLEPEYLMDRLRHECNDLGVPCVAQELEVGGTEVMRMEIRGRSGAVAAASAAAAGSSLGGGSSSSSGGAGPGYVSEGPAEGADTGLRAVVHVMPEDDEGTYAISLMRLVGDTFEFHGLYRQLRERLSDITLLPSAQPAPLGSSSPGGAFGGGLALARCGASSL